MLSPTIHTVRLFLHILGAAARAFARVAWPAFGLAVVTGLWNLTKVDVADTSTTYQITLFVKILLVFASGAAAAVHAVGRSKVALAVGGAIGLLAAVGAMFCGYLLTTGT